MSKTVIVVPVHNAIEYVKRSTEQLKTLTPLTPVVIVDDCSDRETEIYLSRYISLRCQETGTSDYQYVGNSKQQLFTRTANRGIRFAYEKYKKYSTHHTIIKSSSPVSQEEINAAYNMHLQTSPEGVIITNGTEKVEIKYIVVVNTDCNLYPGWLENLEKILDENSDIGIVAYRDSTPDNLEDYEEVSPPGFVTGHCIMFRVEMLEKIGIYCETDLTGRDAPEYAALKGQAHIGSDRFLSYRAVEAGYKSVYCNFNGCGHEAGKSWNHSLHWLSNFNLELLWEPNDTLSPVKYY